MTQLTIEFAKAILTVDPDIDESIIDYVSSICQELADEGEWELEEWVASVEPILGDYIDEEEDITKICARVIKATSGGGGGGGKKKKNQKTRKTKSSG